MEPSLGYLFRCAQLLFNRTFRRLRRDRKPAGALSTVSRKLIQAHEDERRWLARELHDDVNQRLALIIMSLGELVDGDTPLAEFRRGVGSVMQHLSNLNTDVHRLSHRLHSSRLELLGLAAAAMGYCGEVAEQHKVHVDVRTQNIPRALPSEISLSIFRVLQEALQNAVKHSGSPGFEVLLIQDSNVIHLMVRDSGRGFDAAQAIKGRGLGLTSMKERVALIDGELTIDSQPQKGTSIHVRVPLQPTVKSLQEA